MQPTDPRQDRQTRLLAEIDAYARALDPRVVQVSVNIASALQEVAILRPEGTLATDIRTMARLNVAVIVENNDRRESGSAGGGGRIAQMIIGPVVQAAFELADSLDDTARGAGGFGSTGRG